MFYFSGRGVRIYYIGGDAYCESFSDYPIFVQSPIVGTFHGSNPAAVYKVPQCLFVYVFFKN